MYVFKKLRRVSYIKLKRIHNKPLSIQKGKKHTSYVQL